MTQNPGPSDWAATRGDKWGAQLVGMESTLMPVDEPLIGALQLEGRARVAEIGCGGGGTTIEILRRGPPGSVVHGFDISPKLIELARARPRPDGDLAFEVADMATAAPGNPYHRLVSRFGIMFFDDPAAAFGNLVRWLAPGGRLAFAAWGPPADNPWFTSVREAVTRVIEIPQPDPDAPGPFRYADASKLLSLLDQAGFAELDVRDWRGTLPIGGQALPADAANFALSSFSTFGELLAKGDPEKGEQVRQSLTTCFSQYHHDGAVRMEACVRIFTGTRPFEPADHNHARAIAG